MTSNIDAEWIEKHYDPTDEERMQDRFTVYEEMRKQCPVGKSDSYGKANWQVANGDVWYLSRYADISRAVLDTERFSSASSDVARPRQDHTLNSFIHYDPPVHRDYRGIITKPLGPSEMKKLEPTVRGIARDLIDRFRDRGECDLVSEFAYPFIQLSLWQPGLLGTPMNRADEGDSTAWLEKWILDIKNPAKTGQAQLQLLHHVEEILDDRAKNPKDDIPTALLHAEIDGAPLTREEQIHYIWFLTKSGIETPAATMGAILHYLAEHPGVRQMLMDDRARLPKAIEELLRLVGPVHTAQRCLKDDLELHGRQMRAEDPVMLIWDAANHDPEEFEDPDEFRLDRPRTKRHLSFGMGIHRCIGLHFARLELQVALEEIFDSIPDYRVRDDAELGWNVGGVQRTLKALPVVFATGG